MKVQKTIAWKGFRQKRLTVTREFGRVYLIGGDGRGGGGRGGRARGRKETRNFPTGKTTCEVAGQTTKRVMKMLGVEQKRKAGPVGALAGPPKDDPYV